MWRHFHNVCRRRPKDVSRGRPLVLHIRQYGDILRTLHWDVRDVLRSSFFNILRTLVRDVHWHYVQEHMGTSIGCHLGTSSGCPQDLILPSRSLVSNQSHQFMLDITGSSCVYQEQFFHVHIDKPINPNVNSKYLFQLNQAICFL